MREALDDKVVFITGGAQGIGLGIAKACLERGAIVAVADVNEAALAAAAEQVPGLHTYRLDVTDREACAAVARQVAADLGPVHGLFNNAGVADSVSPSRMSGEVWDWVFAVNVDGVYNCIQAFLPSMLERRDGGLIVNTASVAGLVPGGSGFAYSASKHAVVGLSLSLREELAQRDIIVSVVCPGQVATSIMSNTLGLRPEGAEQHTARTKQILNAAGVSLLQHGTPANEAGRTIVAGALEGLPYIFTDPTWRPAIETAHNVVLDSMARCFPLEGQAS